MLCGVGWLVISRPDHEIYNCYSNIDNLDERSCGSIYLEHQGEVYGGDDDEDFQMEVYRKSIKDAAFLRLLVGENVGNFCCFVEMIDFEIVPGGDSWRKDGEILTMIIMLYKESCCGAKKKKNSDEEEDDEINDDEEDDEGCEEEAAAKKLAIASVFERFACSLASLQLDMEYVYDHGVSMPLVMALIGTGYCNKLRIFVENGEDWARALCNCERLEVVETKDGELVKALFTSTPPRLIVVIGKFADLHALGKLVRVISSLARPIFDIFKPLLPKATDLEVGVGSRLSSISAPSRLLLMFKPTRKLGFPKMIVCSRQTARIDLRYEEARNTFGLENLLYE